MLDEGVAMLGGSTATLHVLSDAGDELVVAGAAGLPAGRAGGAVRPHPAVRAAARGRGHAHRPPVVIASEAERLERYPALEALSIEFDPAFVVMPLVDGEGRPFGAMGIGFPEESTCGDGDLEFLEDVAAQCALALDRARLADAAERAQEHLGFLDELSAALSSSLQDRHRAGPAGGDDRAPHRRLVRRPPGRVDGQPPPPGGRRPRRPRPGRPAHPAGPALPPGPGPRRRAGRGAGGRAAAHPGPAGAWPCWPAVRRPADRRRWTTVGEGGVAVFPLHARGRLLGALAFGNRPGRAFTDSDIALAKAVAAGRP